MLFAKIDNGELVTAYANDEMPEMMEAIQADGFKRFFDAPEPDCQEGMKGFERCFREEEDSISIYYQPVEYDREKVENEISSLKSQLEATDYKVIRANEYALSGEPIPYNMAEVHNERENLRLRIRALEKLI